MPDFTLPISMLARVLSDLSGRVSDRLRAKMAGLRAAGKVESLHRRLWQIQKVKTIWNPDRPLSLSTIFYPVFVQHEIDGRTVNRQVESIGHLHYRHCILLGTAGQGKSILMKYLVGKEIRSGERLPLLYELRSYSGGSLEGCLSEKFAHLLGIAKDDEVFASFASNGKISLLLDGFDEVDSANVHAVLQGIEALSYKFPQAIIILTSRLDSECTSLTQFNSVKIRPLEPINLSDFFKKVTKDNEFSTRLTSAILNSSVGMRALVTTPLAATLLAIVYRAGGKIPGEFSEFFEELFQVLLLRHDASKLGWRRQRASGLTDRQLQSAFEAFCFQVRRRRVLSVSRDEAVEIAQEGLNSVGISADPSACLTDLKKVTCLILEEGRRLEFLHASVAQFFASRFVKSLTDGQAESFYAQLLSGHWSTWVSEIGFLKQIDSFRLNKHFLGPDLRNSVNVLSGEGGLERVLGHYLDSSILVRRVASPTDSPKYFVDKAPLPMTYSLRDTNQVLLGIIFSGPIAGCRNWQEVAPDGEDGASITWRKVAERRGVEVLDLARLELAAKLTGLQGELAKSTAVITRVSQTAGLLQL